MTTKQTFTIDYHSYGEAVEAAARREQTGHLPMDPAVRGYLNDDGVVTFDFGSNLTPDQRPVEWTERWDFSTFDPETPIEDYDEATFAELREYAAHAALDNYSFGEKIMDEIQFFNNLPG